MKISKVGNQTNSQDPQAVNSRVFVGNLNTFQCSKTDVERMFQRYGRLAGQLIFPTNKFRSSLKVLQRRTRTKLVNMFQRFSVKNLCIGLIEIKLLLLL